MKKKREEDCQMKENNTETKIDERNGKWLNRKTD